MFRTLFCVSAVCTVLAGVAEAKNPKKANCKSWVLESIDGRSESVLASYCDGQLHFMCMGDFGSDVHGIHVPPPNAKEGEAWRSMSQPKYSKTEYSWVMSGKAKLPDGSAKITLHIGTRMSTLTVHQKGEGEDPVQELNCNPPAPSPPASNCEKAILHALSLQKGARGQKASPKEQAEALGLCRFIQCLEKAKTAKAVQACQPE